MKIIYSICLLVLTFLSGNVFAQYNWKNAGPDNIGSKTRSIVVDGNRVIAGSVGGGLWYSENGGISWNKWESYASQQCDPNVTTIAKKDNKIVVGTGEATFITSFKVPFDYSDVSNDSSGYLGYMGVPGKGVYVSNDNGATWSNQNGTTQAPWGSGTNNNVGPFNSVTKVLIHSSGRIYIGTRSGLFYSDDDLATVDTVATDLDTTYLARTYTGTGSPRWPRFNDARIFDIEEGKDGAVFVGANDERGSRSGGWFLRSVANVGSQSGRPLFLGADSIKVGSNLVKIGIKRSELAVSADKSMLYIAGMLTNGELSGIWRSTDNGANWSVAAPQGNPGFTPLALKDNNIYTFTLAVMPDNPKNVVVAGNSWYAYSDEKGWLQTAQSSSPGSSLVNYVPNVIYTVAFDPNNSKVMYVGTDKQIVKSEDGGVTFSQKSKGYEAALSVSAASLQVDIDDQTDPNPLNHVKELVDVVYTGTSNFGVQLNRQYTSDNPTAQGFGRVSSNNWSDVQVSYIYPDHVVFQGADQGLVRSGNYGESNETFYGFPDTLQVTGLTGTTSSTPDTIIDRNKSTDAGGGLKDRLASQGFYGPNMSMFVLDEVIPDDVLDDGKDAIQALKNYIFFCSGRYLWTVQYPLGSPDGLLPKWNRVSNGLVSSPNTITSIASSGDASHNVFVGTSDGSVYMFKSPHDLVNYDAGTTATSSIIKLHEKATGLPKKRWVSSIAVDPLDPKRVVVTYAGYGGWASFDKTKIVCITNDVTAANPVFTAIGSTLPEVSVYTSEFVVNPVTSTSELMVGTHQGLYVSKDMATFTQEMADMTGDVPVTDIFVRKYRAKMSNLLEKEFTLEKDNTIYVSAFGRGVFYTGDLSYAREGQNPEIPVVTTTDAKLYPNPASGQFKLEVALTEQANVEVSISGIDGKVLLQSSPVEMQEGVNTLTFLTQGLASGVYLVEVKTEKYNKVLKLVIAE
ncbi:MAG: T9SS type A sorting domain-containing protein [Bacteroidia bacterium]|nr:T9SS type A sorting domain-containing protein [Bacteroidia bacterium]